MGFDTQRAVVAAGDGVVARFPGILCVAQGPEPDAVRRLLAVCSAAAGPDPGRALARRLVAWMSGPEAPGSGLRFGTLSEAGPQLAVFLVGEVEAWVDGPDRTVLSGADAAIGTDRLLPRPDVPVVVSAGAIRLPPDPADVFGLRSGVVAGAGVVLHPARTGEGRTALDDDARSILFPAAELRHDWFAADAGSRAEPDALGVPAVTPQQPWRAVGAGETGGWSTHHNGAAGPVNGGGRESAVLAWPGVPGMSPADAVTAAGRHAVLEPLLGREHAGGGPAAGDGGPVEPAVGSNGHEPPDATAAADVAEPSRRALRVVEGVAVADHDKPAETLPPRDVVPSEEPATDAAAEEAPGTAAAASGDDEQEPDGPQVSGYTCDKGHLNDPRAPFCGRCGATMDDHAGGLVNGPRPALGRLVFDDGAIYTVDEGYLVGRMPEADDRVQAGGLRPIVVEDRSGSVSRVHAEIKLTGWDVMLLDAGSRNGTFVAGPEDSGWSPLAPQRSRRLLPGTRVRLGSRTFVFESGSGVR